MAGLWIIFGIVLLFLAFAVFFGYVAYSLRNVKCEVTDQGIKLRGGIYRKFIPKDSIIKEELRLINLNIERGYQPRIKKRGISLPGYKEGWFKLSNREKALLYLGDWSNVVYLSTRDGHAVLLSPEHAEEFIKMVFEL
jgi:hypothetical protein